MLALLLICFVVCTCFVVHDVEAAAGLLMDPGKGMIGGSGGIVAMTVETFRERVVVRVGHVLQPLDSCGLNPPLPRRNQISLRS